MRWATPQEAALLSWGRPPIAWTGFHPLTIFLLTTKRTIHPRLSHRDQSLLLRLLSKPILLLLYRHEQITHHSTYRLIILTPVDDKKNDPLRLPLARPTTLTPGAFHNNPPPLVDIDQSRHIQIEIYTHRFKVYIDHGVEQIKSISSIDAGVHQHQFLRGLIDYHPPVGCGL